MNNSIWCFIFICAISAKSQANSPDVLSKVYIDKAKNVHVVSARGKDVKVTKGGRTARANLSQDRRTVAWLKLNDWIADGDIEPGASELAIYRDGKTRYIKCEPFLRDYWFWMQGKQLATDCGGRHFSGTLTLYDTDTLLVIDSFFQSDVPEGKRPAWSMSGSGY